MSRTLHRIIPIAVLCLTTLLGGCVVAPDYGGYHHGWYDHGGWGWHDHDGWEGHGGGWHR